MSAGVWKQKADERTEAGCPERLLVLFRSDSYDLTSARHDLLLSRGEMWYQMARVRISSIHNLLRFEGSARSLDL